MKLRSILEKTIIKTASSIGEFKRPLNGMINAGRELETKVIDDLKYFFL